MIPINAPVSTIAAGAATARTAYPVDNAASGVRIYNPGAVAVFVKSGGSAVEAAVTDMVIPPATTVVFARNPKDTHLAAITAGTNVTIYFHNCSPNAGL